MPAQPIAKPAGIAGPHGFAFSDDFSASRMGVQWSFYAGDAGDTSRVRHENGALVLRAKGDGPATSSPLWFVSGDRAYEIEVDIDADPGASAGLLLFYSRRLYAGLGFSAEQLLHAQLRAGSAAGQAAAPSASGCASVCATIGTS